MRFTHLAARSHPQETYENCVDFDFTFPIDANHDTPAAAISSAWEDSEWKKEEEFTRAISLGLFDYLRKSRSRGFVVSLSGGADSAAVASLSSDDQRSAGS